MISMAKLVKELTMAALKFEINTMKSPYIAYEIEPTKMIIQRV